MIEILHNLRNKKKIKNKKRNWHKYAYVSTIKITSETEKIETM